MEQEIDQYRLCCGNLLEAKIVDGRVVLVCMACGSQWERAKDNTLRISDNGRQDARVQNE